MPGCRDCCDKCPPPRCGHPKCVKKLVKKEYQVEVPAGVRAGKRQLASETPALPANLPAGSPLAAKAAITGFARRRRGTLPARRTGCAGHRAGEQGIHRPGWRRFIGQTELLSGSPAPDAPP